MAKFLCRNLIIDLYPTIVHKFLVDYLRGGEGWSREKCTVGGVGEAVEVDDVLWGRRRRRAPGKVVEVDSVLRAKRSRSTACSGQSGRGRGQSDRAASRAKWSR
jgi:hypothetical protein